MDPDKKLEKMIRELDPTMSKEKQDSMKTTIKDIRKLLKIKIPKKADGGMALKPVDKKKNPGLSKLPPEVRNKMGYKKDGGMVLEIGLRPATKQEMKMAKEMKKPIKKAGGGMVRGTGAAITGKGFKGVF